MSLQLAVFWNMCADMLGWYAHLAYWLCSFHLQCDSHIFQWYMPNKCPLTLRVAMWPCYWGRDLLLSLLWSGRVELVHIDRVIIRLRQFFNSVVILGGWSSHGLPISHNTGGRDLRWLLRPVGQTYFDQMSYAWKLVLEWEAFSPCWGRNWTHIVQVSWDTEAYESLEVQFKAGLEIAVY